MPNLKNLELIWYVKNQTKTLGADHKTIHCPTVDQVLHTVPIMQGQVMGWDSNTVTRFDEISPLWLKASFGGFIQCFENFQTCLGQLLCYWANDQCCKWPNIVKNKISICHTGVNSILNLVKFTPMKIVFELHLLESHFSGTYFV